mgnify:CR=1
MNRQQAAVRKHILTKRAVLEAAEAGLCGTASDYRVRIRFANGIHNTTELVEQALVTLYKAGKLQATRFGTDHSVHYFID